MAVFVVGLLVVGLLACHGQVGLLHEYRHAGRMEAAARDMRSLAAGVAGA